MSSLGRAPRFRRPRRPERRLRIAAFAAALLLPAIAWANGTAVPLQRPRTMETAPASEAVGPEDTAAPEQPAPEPPEPEPEHVERPAPPPSPKHVDAPMRSGARDTDEAEAAPPPPRPRAANDTSSAVGLHRSTTVRRDKFEHRGFTFDGRIGTQGCTRSLCSSSHQASPGVRLDGFIGGNIRGFVDLGLSGGWGTFGSKVAPGTNALSLYGVNPWLLAAAAAQLGMQLPFNVNQLAVDGAQLRTGRVGPMLRIHFVPRGRMIAYVGSGVGYSLFRARYDTLAGDVRMDFHGIDVPIEAAIGAHVTKNVAIVAQFDFFWARYGIARIVHPDQEIAFPVRLLDSFAQTQGVAIQKTLPHVWSAGVGVRVRI